MNHKVKKSRSQNQMDNHASFTGIQNMEPLCLASDRRAKFTTTAAGRGVD